MRRAIERHELIKIRRAFKDFVKEVFPAGLTLEEELDLRKGFTAGWEARASFEPDLECE